MKPQAEKINAEDQAGFRAGRNTTEQIFNLRILCGKYLQHQQDLYHVFMDFERAFDGVWRAALWATVGRCGVSTGLVPVVRGLYSRVTGAVLFSSGVEDWFRAAVGFRQGCLLSPALFNVFLERIMTDA